MQAKIDDDSQEFAIRVKIQERVWYGTTKTRLEDSIKADTTENIWHDAACTFVAHVLNNILHCIYR